MNGAQGTPALRGFRLSQQQRRWWLLHREAPLRRARVAIEIDGDLDGGRLRRALADVVARHQILRTAFHRRAGLAQPLQVVADAAAPAPWDELDLAGLAAAEREARFESCWRAVGEEDVALEAVPAVRARCLRYGPGRHLLVLSLPALCADRPTLSLVAGELAASYRAARGEDEDLVQYVQVSEWQHETVAEGEEAAEARAYWQEREVAAVEPLRLPWPPGAAPDGQSVAAVRVPVELDPGAVSRLAEHAGAAAALLAAWAVLLGRLGGAAELVVAVESDGRGLADVADVLGPLGRALPVRLRLDARAGFGAVATAAAAALAEAVDLEPHWVPEPQHDRTLGDPGFAWESAPAACGGPRAGIDLRVRRADVPGDLRPVTLRCTAAERLVTAALEVDPRRLDPAGAERLAAGLGALVAAAAERPETPLEALPLLPPAERRRLLVDFNVTATPLPEPLFVHRQIAAQAARDPEREAVRGESEALTYASLEARANRLAHHLRGLGVGPETVVALWLPRTPELIVALLAVLKTGGAYLPVDLAQPGHRLAGMLADAGAAVAVVRGGAQPPPVAGLRVVDLDRAAAAVAGCPATAPEGDPAPANLAYLIFTSGSTGRPKGVGVAHHQLAAYVHGVRTLLALPHGASFATVSTFAADLGNTSLFGALCGGGCLHVLGEDRVLDGEAMADDLARHPVDVLKIVPSHFQALYRSCSRPESLLPRRCLVLGGEACPGGLVAELMDAAPHLTVVNHYGPTETTVGACAHRAAPAQPPPRAQVPIGRPLANARLYVLDERLEPLPEGVAGELFIGGAGVARGYVGRAAETAERFLPDPFAGAPGARMYRSGDRARHLSEGGVECLGRLDRQVKVRGFRVEPDEVAAALRDHPGVEAAVVVPSADAAGDLRLSAYVVPHRRWAAEVDGRRRHALPNGLAVVHQNRNETEYLYQEIFVRHTYAHHGIRLREDAVVLDLGGNIGMFTLFVACCRPRARIYAFEPLPPLFRTLRLNAELHAPEAKVFPVGLADAEGTAEFAFYPQHTMMSGLAAYADPALERRVVERSLRNAERLGSAEAAALLEHADELLGGRFTAERHRCRLRRLSDVLREEGIAHVDLLKIDVQRAELDVLRGLDEDDWRRVDQVVMELHQEDGAATAGRIDVIVELLAAHGFAAVVEQDPLLVGTDRYALYARRTDREIAGEELAALAATAAPATRVLDGGQLRAWAAQRLPEAMCPAQFVLLEALPLTGNGKVDLAALPPPEEARSATYLAPRSPLEAQLAAIWAEVLHLERVGVHDNYFELGGDSMQSIRVIARAARAGLRLTAQHFFEHQTVAALAAALAAAAPGAAPPPQGREVPLTPAQLRFLAATPAPDGWGLPLTLEARRPLDRERLASAFAAVTARHGALHLRFHRDGDGWRQVGAADAAAAPEWVDVADLSADDLAAACAAAGERLRAGLDLGRGPLVRLLCLDRGPERPPRLLLLCHPLVADEASWRILVEDLAAAYLALERGEPPRPAGAPRAFASWAAELAQLGASAAARDEAAMWLDGRFPSAEAGAVAAAGAGPAAAERPAGAFTVCLEPAETRALAGEVAAGAWAEIDELLLLALCEAHGEQRPGAPLLVDVERDGRLAGLLGGCELTWAVGCFTAVAPRCLRLTPSAAAEQRLREIKEQLRAVPRQGVAFGAVRDLGNGREAAEALRRLAAAAIAFRYLGDLDVWSAAAAPLGFVPEARTLELLRRAAAPQPYRVGVHAWIADGRLHVAWTPGAAADLGEAEELAGRFVARLRALLAAGVGSGAVSVTDFPLAGLGGDDLRRIATLIGEAEG
jgi:amino acid adenylation domain-containing protein/FkbM family methyltransferase/non-ribosomal peptide synthase protein (TIGR01720 family)